MRRAILTIGLAILLLVLGKPAKAEWVTIQIEGVVDYVHDGGNYFEGKVNVGSSITGWYIYDTGVPDIDSRPKVGHYLQNNSPSGVHLEIENIAFESNPDDLDIQIDISNDDTPLRDEYRFISYSNLPIMPYVQTNYILWKLIDYSGNALSSDALPTAAPNLNQWSFNLLELSGKNMNGPGSWLVSGHVISAVPEPGTMVLLAIGSFILFSKRNPKI